MSFIYIYDKALNKSFIINLCQIVWADINTSTISMSDNTVFTLDAETMSSIIRVIRGNTDDSETDDRTYW